MACFEQSGVYYIDIQGVNYLVNSEQKPNVKINTKIVNRKVYYTYTINFLLYGLNNLESLKDNTGAVVYFYNNSSMPINRKLNFKPGSLKSVDTHTYEIELTTERPTLND